MEKEKESEREIYEKEIAYLDLKNKIVKEIHPILLSLIVPILSDKQFDFFTTILKKDLKIPQEDSFFLSFYCEIQPIIGECKQNPLFLTPSQKEEIKNTFLQLLEKWKFKNRITYHNGEDNPYWDKISYQPKYFLPKAPGLTLRTFAKNKGIDYNSLMYFIRKYPLTMATYLNLNIKDRPHEKLYYIKQTDYSNDNNIDPEMIYYLIKAYQRIKKIYSFWLALLKWEKKLTKSGATKWIQRKIKMGIVPPDFFYSASYIKKSEQSHIELLHKIDKSQKEPVIPKEQWNPPDKTILSFQEIRMLFNRLEYILQEKKNEFNKLLQEAKNEYNNKPLQTIKIKDLLLNPVEHREEN